MLATTDFIYWLLVCISGGIVLMSIINWVDTKIRYWLNMRRAGYHYVIELTMDHERCGWSILLIILLLLNIWQGMMYVHAYNAAIEAKQESNEAKIILMDCMKVSSRCRGGANASNITGR